MNVRRSKMRKGCDDVFRSDWYQKVQVLYQFYNMDKNPIAGCQNCTKQQQLIQKYLSLIDLLKKKNDHSNQSIHLKPEPATASQITPSTLKSYQIALIFQLISLEYDRKLCSFRKMEQRAIKEQCHKGFRLALALERCIGRRLQEGLRSVWIAKHQSSSIGSRGLQQQKSASLFQLDISNNPRNASCYFPSLSSHGNEKIHALSRKMFALHKENEGLKWSKKMLEEQIEENYRRQEIESKKKKESLEMLAEEMAEKNQIIVELQTALSFYEKRQGRSGNNVLDDDGVALRRENQSLQKINEKLNIELEKRSEQLSRLQEQLKTVSERLAKFQSENVILKEKNFEMGVQLENLQKRKKDYYNMSSFLQKKLSNLKKYEKVISTHLKVIEQHNCSDKSSFNVSTRLRSSQPTMLDEAACTEHNEDRQEHSFAPISHFEAQYKIQKILNYIFNIELEDVWISNQERLFDNEELQVLNNLKLKFIQLNQQAKAIKKEKEAKISQEIKPKEEHRFQKLRRESGDDEVYFNQHQISGSIFEVLESQRGCKEKELDPIVQEFSPQGCGRCQGHRQNGDVGTRRDNQNFTMKLLQLQLQKNKQIEKISELKNKIMHIRCIIMNFLKSLEMRSLKPQGRDIVEILFELFEYSEEQKEIILHQNRKEKRFLGFF